MKRQHYDARTDFSLWMGHKQSESLKGEILDPEAEKMIPVSKARAEILLNVTKRRGLHHRKMYQEAIKGLSAEQAQAEGSDSFAFDRVRSRLLNGCDELRDYGVSFVKNSEMIEGRDGPIEKITFSPINWRHA